MADFEAVIEREHIDVVGHANNAVYIRLFEEARWKLCRDRGLVWDDLSRQGLGTAILEMHIFFKRELRLGDVIQIETKGTQLIGKVAEIGQEMYRVGPESRELCCTGTFRMGILDMKLRKLVAPEPRWLKVLGLG